MIGELEPELKHVMRAWAWAQAPFNITSNQAKALGNSWFVEFWIIAMLSLVRKGTKTNMKPIIDPEHQTKFEEWEHQTRRSPEVLEIPGVIHHDLFSSFKFFSERIKILFSTKSNQFLASESSSHTHARPNDGNDDFFDPYFWTNPCFWVKWGPLLIVILLLIKIYSWIDSLFFPKVSRKWN